MAGTCTTRTLAAIFRAASDRYESAFKELCALDAVAGDGDLGISLSAGFKAATEMLEAEPDGELSSRLRLAAFAFNRAAPSTLGTLITAALLAAAAVPHDGSMGDGELASSMLLAAVRAIEQSGKARPGDKTILDALGPAVDAFATEVERGGSVSSAVYSARHAARVGAEATKTMLPKAGRARWMGERSLGSPDAGAVAAVWFFDSWKSVFEEAPESDVL